MGPVIPAKAGAPKRLYQGSVCTVDNGGKSVATMPNELSLKNYDILMTRKPASCDEQ